MFSSRHGVKLPEDLSREACKIGKEPVVVVVIIVIIVIVVIVVICKLSLYIKRKNISF